MTWTWVFRYVEGSNKNVSGDCKEESQNVRGGHVNRLAKQDFDNCGSGRRHTDLEPQAITHVESHNVMPQNLRNIFVGYKAIGIEIQEPRKPNCEAQITVGVVS